MINKKLSFLSHPTFTVSQKTFIRNCVVEYGGGVYKQMKKKVILKKNLLYFTKFHPMLRTKTGKQAGKLSTICHLVLVLELQEPSKIQEERRVSE